MSAYRASSSSNKPSSSYHHSAGDGGGGDELNNAALLGLNYPKEKTVVNYDIDTAYILRSLSTLPPFPFPTLPSPSPPQASSSSSSSALLKPAASLVLIPLSLEPPLPSYVPDTLIPAIYSHIAAYRSLLSSSHYEQARAELEAAEALLSHPEIWDEVVNGRPWREALEADRKRRADWEEYALQREKAGAAQPQRPAKLAVADADAAMSSITEEAAEGAEGASAADAAGAEQAVADGDAVSASVSHRASSAQPEPPAEIPQLQAATRLVWGCYLPLCWAELSRHEGKDEAALISSWRAWLAHDGFVQGEWKGQEEEKRAEERRQRGASVADEEDEQGDDGKGGKQAGALSATAASAPSVHAMQPFTFPSPLSAAVLASLAVSAYRLHEHRAALLAFHAALTVLAATTPPASSSPSYLSVDLSSLLNNIGCSLTRLSPPHPSLAFSYLTAAEESLAARLASHHPRLEAVRLNLSKLEGQRGGVADCGMRAMMDGMRDALQSRAAEAEAVKLSKVKKPAGKKPADAAAASPPGSSGGAMKAPAASGSGSAYAAIEGFGSDAAFFQQAKAGEEEKVAEAQQGEEALWLRGWKVELSEYEKLIVASLASGADTGGKGKKAAGGKKGKAKKS